MDFVVCGQSNNEFVLGEHMLLFDFVIRGLIIRLCIKHIIYIYVYVYEHMLLVVVRIQN